MPDRRVLGTPGKLCIAGVRVVVATVGVVVVVVAEMGMEYVPDGLVIRISKLLDNFLFLINPRVLCSDSLVRVLCRKL